MKLIAFFLLLSFTLSAQTGKVSAYLTWKEATGTNHSIPNKPDARQTELIKKFGKECFDKIRAKAGSPLYVSSLFRSPAVNAKVGGARKSDHMILEDVVACDIDQDGRGKVGNRALFFIIMHNFDFQKLIWEYTDVVEGQSSDAFGKPKWVHISWSSDPVKNKMKRVYKAVKRGNKTVYLNFSTLN